MGDEAICEGERRGGAGNLISSKRAVKSGLRSRLQGWLMLDRLGCAQGHFTDNSAGSPCT